MPQLRIVFASKEDCDYFVSKEADHWWYMPIMYHAVRMDDLIIETDDSFYQVTANPSNGKFLFSRRIEGDDGQVKYISFSKLPTIIKI